MSKEFSKYRLPKGWVITDLGSIAIFINGKSFKSIDWRKEGIPIIRIQNLNNKTASYNYISDNQEIEEKYVVENGDLLFAWSGTPGTSFGAHIWCNSRAFLNQHIYKVISFSGIDRRFLFYLLNQLVLEFVKKSKGTAGLAHITKRELEATQCVIPPLKEQDRIVAQLEELFSELDHSIENLILAQAQLKVYRQAILKQAFEGKLTEKWRKENNPEPAEKLLDQIEKEQQDKFKQGIKYFEDAVLIWENNGRKGKKPKRPNKGIIPEDFSIHELSEFPPIPGMWSKVGKVAQVEMGQSPPGNTYNDNGIGVPLINGPIEFGKSPFSKTLKIKWTTKPTKLCKEGDLILCVRGSTTGRQNIADFEACIGRGVCSIRSKGILQEYVNHFFNYSTKSIFNMGTGSTFPSISAHQLNEFRIPIFSYEEQTEVVTIIEQQFSIIDKLEESINYSLNSVEILRQTILKRAFTGELVEQDTSEEPADKLLEKIKRQKTEFLKLEIQRKKSEKPLKNRLKMAKHLKSIIDILRENTEPIMAKKLWEDSIYEDDIDGFYAALKKHIEAAEIIELPRKGKESYLKLADSK